MDLTFPLLELPAFLINILPFLFILQTQGTYVFFIFGSLAIGVLFFGHYGSVNVTPEVANFRARQFKWLTTFIMANIVLGLVPVIFLTVTMLILSLLLKIFGVRLKGRS